MDPQDQFKQRYDTFVKARQDQIAKAKTAPPPQKRTPFNKFYALGIIVGILIILPVTFVLLRNNANKGEIAFTPKNQSISSEELQVELLNMLGPRISDAKANPTIQQNAEKNILVRRAAQALGALPAQIASEEDSNYALDQFQIQRSLEKKVVSSRTIDNVNVYIPPIGDTSDQQATTVENLTFIRNELTAGKSVKEAYEALVAKLGTDPGYAVSENAYVTRTSGYIPPYITALFAAKTGDVTQVINANGTNYMVAKIKDAVDTSYSSLAAWESANIK